MKINFKYKNMVKLTASEKEQYLNELVEFLKIPSISADSAFSEQVNQAAQWVADGLTKAGAEEVRIVPTKGYPIVYGEKIIDPNLNYCIYVSIKNFCKIYRRPDINTCFY